MRYYITVLFLFFHFSTFSQSASSLSPADSTLKTDPSISVSQSPAGFRTFISTKVFPNPEREIKILTHSALIITSVSAAGVVTYSFGDEPLRDFSLHHRTRFTTHVSALLEPLGRSGNMLAASGAIYCSGILMRDPKLQRAGILLASSLLINDFVTNKLKDEFQRSRPDEAPHNSYFDGGEGGRHHASFPSAHTSTAFAFAASLATVYKDHKWVPPVAYGTATLVGLSRIYDNHHWATDVMAGAAVGIISAKTTNIILKLTEKQLVKRKVNIYVTPKLSSGALGLNAGGVF
jgi:membrane-associated phospholipid phosphatase